MKDGFWAQYLIGYNVISVSFIQTSSMVKYPCRSHMIEIAVPWPYGFRPSTGHAATGGPLGFHGHCNHKAYAASP